MRFFIKIIGMVGIVIVFSVAEIIYSTNVFLKVAEDFILIVIFLYLLKTFLAYSKLLDTRKDVFDDDLMENEFCNELINYIEKYTNEKIKKNIVEIFNKQTELTALQSQINPHFLYNTLDSIRGEALCNDDDNVADMIATLGSFFRYSISKNGKIARLRDELENVKNYMKIQEYRFRGRFHLEIEVGEEDVNVYDCYVPRLILQPIVENAIYHGLEGVRNGGIVRIEVNLIEKYLMIMIMDNGRGMKVEELKELNRRIFEGDYRKLIDNPNSNNTGIALPNIYKRINLLYGEDYGLTVYSSFGQGTDVEILLPIQLKAYEDEL